MKSFLAEEKGSVKERRNPRYIAMKGGGVLRKDLSNTSF
jgi:hypothetical protein